MNRLDSIIVELSTQLVRLEQVSRELEFAERRMKHHRPNIDTDSWAMNFYVGACMRTAELIQDTIDIQSHISQLEIQLRNALDERERRYKASLGALPELESIEL